jgi:iodotyrosine deiodinase
MSMEKRVPLENYIEYPQAEMRDRVSRFTQNLLRRRTVRDYSDKPVERAVI